MEWLYTVGRIGKLVRHAGTPQKGWGFRAEFTTVLGHVISFQLRGQVRIPSVLHELGTPSRLSCFANAVFSFTAGYQIGDDGIHWRWDCKGFQV